MAGRDVPDEFKCPITHEVMGDPVTIADGRTYERSAIEQWLARSNTSPMTGAILAHTHVVPNENLRILISSGSSRRSVQGVVSQEAPPPVATPPRPRRPRATRSVDQAASGAAMAQKVLEWAETFPNLPADSASMRVELQALEGGDKPHWESTEGGRSNYFKFAQLQIGAQAVPGLRENIFVEKLDPKGAPARLREAWWTVARSIFQGSGLPPAMRVLALCERREGGRSAFVDFVALVWTGVECKVVACTAAPTYTEVYVQVQGNLSQTWMRDALSTLVRNARAQAGGLKFNDLIANFRSVLCADDNGHLHSPPTLARARSWKENWEFDVEVLEEAEDLDEVLEPVWCAEEYVPETPARSVRRRRA